MVRLNHRSNFSHNHIDSYLVFIQQILHTQRGLWTISLNLPHLKYFTRLPSFCLKNNSDLSFKEGSTPHKTLPNWHSASYFDRINTRLKEISVQICTLASCRFVSLLNRCMVQKARWALVQMFPGAKRLNSPKTICMTTCKCE